MKGPVVGYELFDRRLASRVWQEVRRDLEVSVNSQLADQTVDGSRGISTSCPPSISARCSIYAWNPYDLDFGRFSCLGLQDKLSD
jgi:hypothetical protein